MKARRFITGELSNIGFHSLSNSGFKAVIQASSSGRRSLQWIFPITSAIFYASEPIATPLQLYLP